MSDRGLTGIMIRAAAAVLICIALIVPERARALEIGAYGTAGGGEMLFTVPGELVSDRPAMRTTAVYGCGIMLDTGRGRGSLLDYRLTLGYEFRHSGDTMAAGLHNIAATHTLSFGIIQSEPVRFWMGPRIGLGYLWGRNSYTGVNSLSSDLALLYPGSIMYGLYLSRERLKFSYFHLQAGIALGVDIHIGRNVSVPVEVGFRYHFNTDFRGQDTAGGFSSPFPVMGPEGFCSAGVLYRFTPSPDKNI